MLISPVLVLRHLSRPCIPHSRRGIFLVTNRTVSINLDPRTCKHYSTEEGPRKERSAKGTIKETSSDDERVPDINDPSDWVAIYKFNQIKAAKFMCKVKVYQTGLTVLFCILIHTCILRCIIRSGRMSQHYRNLCLRLCHAVHLR